MGRRFRNNISYTLSIWGVGVTKNFLLAHLPYRSFRDDEQIRKEVIRGNGIGKTICHPSQSWWEVVRLKKEDASSYVGGRSCEQMSSLSTP